MGRRRLREEWGLKSQIENADGGEDGDKMVESVGGD